jgi:glycerol uptake facilitator-like aquaporin
MGFSFAEMTGLTEIMRDRNVWKALVAEFVGTLVLVFVGCGSCLSWDETGPTMVQISLAFGITVATMAQV